MERIVTYTATSEEEGLTISSWLRRLGFSVHQIGRMKFRNDGICLNGKRARVNVTIKEGDLLALQLMDKGEDLREGTDRAPSPGRVDWADPDPSVGPLTILYEDPDILALHKKQGLVCHPSPGHYADTLANGAAAYLHGQGIRGRIYLLGRLDRDTSGIVIFAKHAEAAAMLGDQRDRGEFEKIYLAEVRGVFEEGKETGIVDGPLRRIRDTMHMEISPEGKKARTFYRVLGTEKEGEETFSLVRCRIEQGRTHQIRVHMASAGHPLAGDPLYGMGASPIGIGKEVPRAENVDLHLHAFYCRFRQPFTGEEILIRDPAPAWALRYKAFRSGAGNDPADVSGKIPE